jgi:hypothetical protein
MPPQQTRIFSSKQSGGFQQKTDADLRPSFCCSNSHTFSNSGAEFDGSADEPASTAARFASIFTAWRSRRERNR